MKQVRTKSNKYSTVKYDSAGNILTPERKKELKKISKENAVVSSQWVKMVSKFEGRCCVCNKKISSGTEMLWNKQNKQTKHAVCVANKCRAIKTDGKVCFGKITNTQMKVCHIHDPNGKFRQQLKRKGMGKGYVVKCDHKWYMRDEGIQCDHCSVMWQKEMG